ncbi:MAG: hypothetical protein ACI39Q_02140, partial [Wujia sp.]
HRLEDIMTGENLIEGLEGLSKIDSVSNVLYVAIYWIAVIFVILFVTYIIFNVKCFLNRKRGIGKGNDDDFLDD